MAQVNKRRLVLHFDLNNTILMKDASKGLNTVDNVYRIVCKSAWGKVCTRVQDDGSKGESQWILAHDQLTFSRPEAPSMVASLPESDQENLNVERDIISYQDYIDQVHPQVTNDDGSKDQATEEARYKLQSNFAKPGGAGAKFKNQQEKIMKTLTLPKGAKEELGITGDQGLTYEASDDEEKQESEREEDEDVDPRQKNEEQRRKLERKMNAILFGEGRYHIIPSFFRMLMFLKKQKKEFAVAFRTFGSELENVVYEYNKFCQGEHPCFNGRNNTPLVKMDGSKNSKDMQIRDENQRGTFYRNGDQLGDNVMVTGKHTRLQDPTDVNRIDDHDKQLVIRDHLEIFQHMLETWKKFGSMAIADDYPAWKASEFSNARSKPLFVDQADYNTQHIFFDDNADEGDECIVDVRDIITGERIEQHKYMDMYVVKVHPHRAILEPEYFIKKIEECELRRDEEIQRVEAGIEEDDVEREGAAKKFSSLLSHKNQEVQETEWEKIQKMPAQEYLMRTVLPVLYQGMRVVDMERPAAPLEYLSIYLLKNQDLVKLPPRVYTEPKQDNSGENASQDNEATKEEQQSAM